MLIISCPSAPVDNSHSKVEKAGQKGYIGDRDSFVLLFGYVQRGKRK